MSSSWLRRSLSLAVYHAVLTAGVSTCSITSESSYSSSSIIKRDVCIIGGGASGTYAALKLQEMGKSVAVVERHAKFGGHTATYTVPGTDTTIDYGVQGYGNNDIVRDFFAAYDIPLQVVKLSETGFGTTQYVDFSTGDTIANFTFDPNLTAYREQMSLYPYLQWGTAIPEPVPEDFSLSFGDFATKYGLESSVYNIYYSTEGLGDLLSQPTLTVFKYLNEEYLAGLLPDSDGFLVTEHNDNQEVYLLAQEDLGADALASSHVVAAVRNKHGVKIAVSTPKGNKLIIADKLLVTIPPTPENMSPFFPDRTERSLFSQFGDSGWNVGLVNISGLPQGMAYQNTHPSTPFNLPVLPALYQISPTQVPGIYLVRYGAPGEMSDESVQADIIATVERVRSSVLGAAAEELEAPEMLAYATHWPFGLHVSGEAIAGGFYNDLDALQGHRSTWYTGAAFVSHTVASIWNFTQELVPAMYE